MYRLIHFNQYLGVKTILKTDMAKGNWEPAEGRELSDLVLKGSNLTLT